MFTNLTYNNTVIINVIADISVCLCLFMYKQKNEVIFVHQTSISNRLTYLVHAKSTSELIWFVLFSFGFSDRSVRTSVSAKRWANCWDQSKKWLHLLAYLRSQSEFRTQRKADPKWNDPVCHQFSRAKKWRTFRKTEKYVTSQLHKRKQKSSCLRT